ncbi:hypothetical protein UFOVP326_111 [uncultured Caudovirales phage]|uniref:HNH endonuclease n=1 Tax=uncultured Caudovirales phage TaxID=2100421 RepID=A0A6J5LVP3_9CAUD|nr:hypothetical protein UFOVP326_111 [uncultured Caudovirales phage]
MPIRRENRRLYPADWRRIAEEAKAAAGFRCQRCGVRDRSWGWRDAAGHFHAVRPGPLRDAGYQRPPFWLNWGGRGQVRVIEIMLATAHRDHDPSNNDAANHLVLCQRCHLAHDAGHHRGTAAANGRAAMATLELPLGV